MKSLFLFAMGLIILPTAARADEPPRPGILSGSISGGYAHLIGHADPASFPHDSYYVDMQFMYRTPNLRVPAIDAPVWIGIGSSISSYGNSHDATGTFYGQQYDDASIDSYFSDFSIEARAAVPIRFGGEQGFFITPELGAGLLVNNYAFRSLNIDGNELGPDDHTGAAFCIRPGIVAGYAWDKFSAGAEISYVAAWGDFGQFGGSLQEIHTGVFISFIY